MNFFEQMLIHDANVGLSRMRGRLWEFAKESNKIEGITSVDDTNDAVARLEILLLLKEIKIADLCIFNTSGVIRQQSGMNVCVGTHMPPFGGQHIIYALDKIVEDANKEYNPYKVHIDFETLHPFTDGNGRTGRAIWLWQMVNQYKYNIGLGFLHAWYYKSLENSRGN